MRFALWVGFLLIFSVPLFAQKVPVLRVDPSSAFGGTISTYFEKVEYIPLETTKECLLGAADKLVITDSSFVIGDWDTKSVYFFSFSGKFINKVKLPSEGSLGMDISYERDRNRIAIRSINWSTEKGDCKYYTLLGKLQSNSTTKVNKETATQVYLGNGYNIVTGISYLNRGEKARDKVYSLFSLYKDDKQVKSFLPYNQSRSLVISRLLGGYSLMWGHPLRVKEGVFYAAEPLNFTVYRINKDSAVRAFKFVLPADRVIKQEIIEKNDYNTTDSLVDEIAYNNKIILQISNICFVQQYLSFKFIPKIYLSKPGSEAEFQYNFLYDTAAKKLISLERLSTDASNYFLPVFGHKANRDGLEFYDGYFYTSLSSLEMINQWEKTKTRVTQYPPLLERYYNTENRKSNPVIVKLKLRSK
ncbi:MAG: 6-bladed beta-propeller [Bacteroidetes bacterium]|nr:6-bladed beta-propeller [Bacteroidota bacterium]